MKVKNSIKRLIKSELFVLVSLSIIGIIVMCYMLKIEVDKMSSEEKKEYIEKIEGFNGW